MALLLFLAAVLEQRRAKHRNAHTADRVERANAIHLFLQYARFRAGEPAATILPRPSRRSPTLLSHHPLPTKEVGIGWSATLRKHDRALTLQRRREIRGNPTTYLASKRVQPVINPLSRAHTS